MLTQKNNIILHGLAASAGITIGKVYNYSKEVFTISDEKISNVEEALKNFELALEQSYKELNKILKLAQERMGEERAAIFEAHLMILQDQFLISTIKGRIEKEERSPEFIIHDEITKYQQIMLNSEHVYMKERASDIEDIKNRLIKNYQKRKWVSRIVNDVIVVAKNLTPADTILFSRCNVLGYVTEQGGLTSHAAIISRSLNLPAVVGVIDATKLINDNDIIIVDGYNGEVIIKPTEDIIEKYKQKIEKIKEYNKKLEKIKNIPAQTTDGVKITLLGNMDLKEEIENVIESGIEGVGLLRTEELFIESGFIPSEKEQVKIYKKLSEKLYPAVLTIRAFDVGGDKFLPADIKEDNPFLGWRGIRFLLDKPEIFISQIRAVLKASVNGNIQFMLPMVSTLREVIKAREIIDRVKAELDKDKIPYDKNMKIGIMLEVPSVAVILEDFANYVDFVSIGTNDLIQYLLAVDRGNSVVSNLYDEFDTAVIAILKRIMNRAKKVNLPVSICGQMASDLLALPLLLGVGITTFSIIPSALPHIKNAILNLSVNECKELAEKCLTYPHPDLIKKEVTDFLNSKNLLYKE
jgi:phosphotransferase system enzyme I (PtsI)